MLYKKEVIQQIGSKANRPGLYLGTHCQREGHPDHTKSFTAPSSRRATDRFRVVLQRRVKPGAFKTHRASVKTGEAWRLVDPDPVRRYGILVKRRKAYRRG